MPKYHLNKDNLKMDLELEGHLLYIDITQMCGIGCDFCMYGDKHFVGESLSLSEKSKSNLAALINSSDVKRVSISGEGEPLNNLTVFKEILSLSEGGVDFEFITSGFLRTEKLFELYESVNEDLSQTGDRCNFRLSSDSHHIEKIANPTQGASLDYFFRKSPSNITFSFRSIDTDREFTRQFLLSQLNKFSRVGEIRALTELEDELVVGGSSFRIDYKNLVHPDLTNNNSFLGFYDYIELLEVKSSKKFTFGSLNKAPLKNGLDLTVKPDGEVYLYGVEHKKLGNIHRDDFSWTQLKQTVQKDRELLTLYSVPLLKLLQPFENHEKVIQAIRRANNPYWLFKSLAQEGLVKEIMSHD